MTNTQPTPSATAYPYLNSLIAGLASSLAASIRVDHCDDGLPYITLAHGTLCLTLTPERNEAGVIDVLLSVDGHVTNLGPQPIHS